MKKFKMLFTGIVALVLGVLPFQSNGKVYSSDIVSSCEEPCKQEKFEIESLSSFIGVYPDEQYNDLSEKIYSVTDFICEDYPRHKEWFFKKHLPEVKAGTREVFFVRNNEDSIVSVCFVKKSDLEKKICTLYVSPNVRKCGLGTKLIDKAIEFLGTSTPLITIAEYKKSMFEGIIKKYNWKLTETVNGIYNDKYAELCYNGSLKN